MSEARLAVPSDDGPDFEPCPFQAMKAVAMAYTVVEEKNGVLVRFYDTITADDVYRSMNAIWTLPRWQEFRYEICDLRDLKAGTVDECDMKSFAHLDNAATIGARRLKLAFVATEPETIGMCQFYMQVDQPEGLVVQIFASLEDARQWVES